MAFQHQNVHLFNLHEVICDPIKPVTLQWVPAHVGLSGNEHADRLAKTGGQLSQPTNPVTYQELKLLLHARYRARWDSHNNGYHASQDPIRQLERHHQTIIFRLRTGHCCLRSHLKRIGVSDTPTCECGLSDETPDHILQSCPRFSRERREMWPEAAGVKTKLWGSAADLIRTARYVTTLGLRV